jgi:hypothetical protein
LGKSQKKPDKRNKKARIVIPIAIAIVSVILGVVFLSGSIFVKSDDNIGNSNNDNPASTDDQTQNSTVNETRDDPQPEPYLTGGAQIGNSADMDLDAGMQSLPLEEDLNKVSFRFTAKYTGRAETIVFNLLYGENSTIAAGLQEDNGNGKPSGEWLAEGIGNGVDGQGFMQVKLEKPTDISEGKVYHLVIQNSKNNNSDLSANAPRVRIYHHNNEAQPLNDNNLEILWPDSNMNTLYYETADWQEINNWPIFVVKYSDGRSEGQPYSLAAPWVVYGPRYVGQEIVPSNNYVVEKFGFVVAIKGNPADKLYYEVRDSKNNVLRDGLFSERGNLSLQREYVEVTLDSPLTLRKDSIYRFVIFSPRTVLDQPYHLYGHEFTFDTSLSYGGLQNILTISYDSGSTWHRWEDADTIFLLQTQ